MRKFQFSHIYHQGCSTSFITTLLADPKSVKTFTTNDSRVVPHRSTELAHCRLVSQIGRDATVSAGYERMMEVILSYTPYVIRPETKDGKKLLVGESNPGRLRDRQKCYQLHQRGRSSVHKAVEAPPTLTRTGFPMAFLHRRQYLSA